MKTLRSFFILVCFVPVIVFSQGVGVGTTTPDASAALDVTSVTQGILVPRMSTAQRDAISSPANGLLVFDLTTNSFWFKGGGQWIELIDTSNTVVHKMGTDIYMGMGGNVGVGTTTPTSKLEVKTSPGLPGIRHTDGAVTMQTNTTASAATIGTTTNHSLQLFANNGTNHFTINPTGYVGIGTASPQQQLHVNGNAFLQGFLGIGMASPEAPLHFSATNGDKIALSGNSGSYYGFGMAANMMQMYTPNSSGAIGFGYGSSNAFTENVRITGDGKVGIGTNAPTEKLSVNGNANFSGSLTIGGGLVVGGAIVAGAGIAVGGAVGFVHTDGSVSMGSKIGSDFGKLTTFSNHSLQLSANDMVNQMTLATNGNVGIGTNMPGAKLDVKTPSDVLSFQFGDEIIKAGGKVGSGKAKFGTVTPHPMQLSANDFADQLTLATNGNVGIGTATPNAKLEVKTPSDVQGLLFGDDIIKMATKVGSGKAKFGTVTPHPMQLSANDLPDQLTLATNGNVGIGTATPNAKFEVKTPSDVQGLILGDDIIKMATKVGSGKAKFGTVTPHPMQLSANDLPDQLTLATNGNVGIGTATPNAKFEVKTPSDVQGLILGDDIIKMATKVGSGKAKFGTVTPHPMQLSANDLPDQLTLATNGNVGVGTATPLQKMHVEGTSYISQKLGIGVSAPNADLQFASSVANRKMVLFETANNDNQYFGFGINTSAMRYQVDGPVASHIFYAGSSPTTSNELMRITGQGYVGIGIASPQGSLEVARGTGTNGTAMFKGTTYNSHFNNSTAEDTYIRGGKAGSNVMINDVAGLGNVGIGMATPLNKMDIQAGSARTGTHPIGLPLYVTGDILAGSQGIEFRHANGSQGIGIGFNTIYAAGSNTDQDLGLSAKGLGELIFKTQQLERVRVNGIGNVGIGTSSPNAPLQFGNTVQNRKMVLYESANNDHQFYGLGINGFTLRYQVSGTTDNHIFYAGTSSTTSNELMRIQGNGNVGIGTGTPHAPLQFANAGQNRKVVLYENANDDHQFNGLGADQTTMRYQVGNIEYDHVFYAATSPTTSNELMRVKGNGDVDVAGKVLIGYQKLEISESVPALTYGESVACDCPVNTVVIGGGWYGAGLDVIGSRPFSTTSWLISLNNLDVNAHTLTVYAICARMGQ